MRWSLWAVEDRTRSRTARANYRWCADAVALKRGIDARARPHDEQARPEPGPGRGSQRGREVEVRVVLTDYYFFRAGVNVPRTSYRPLLLKCQNLPVPGPPRGLGPARKSF